MDAVALPERGQIVRVRSRTWLVEGVDEDPGYGSTVSLACLDDDAQGQQIAVNWDLELDRRILSEEAWKDIGKKGFDPPRQFSAFLNTLNWNCVTATNPFLFQSPFRAGIRIEPYQLEPLRKALRLPRVNLFIADDVGLGKTIEAGLIASELLLRKRVQDIVVACPPSMLLQWKDELENRFGLIFEIFNRDYMERIRGERGHSVNAWTTFPRFLISHKLLIDETYVAPLREWLDNLRPGSLLILDEAHHAAPSSGSKYAIDSQITKAIRNLAFRFEHRLFLSATPHNGHSNSFSALLNILDKDRFIPGVPVVKDNRDAVMVRRLKDDLRAINIKGFPVRNVIQVNLPEDIGEQSLSPDTPELKLAELLQGYINLRLEAMAGLSRGKRASFELLTSKLQQRLLSSVEAFAKSLRTHRKTMEKIWAKEALPTPSAKRAGSLLSSVDADDDRASLKEEELDSIYELEMEQITAATSDSNETGSDAEKILLKQMSDIAERARTLPDAKIRYLVKWIQENQCEGACPHGVGSPAKDAKWKTKRVIIFTEWDDTKRYIEQQLTAAIEGTDQWEERIAVFHGPTSQETREHLKRAFNAPPEKNPLRILICTDAAREGLNLQAHCQDLFHFDVPWNPARMEQRNGRIDRKLQPAPEVNCHYFFYTDRPEDRVLRVLARKTVTIKDELGSFSEVISKRLEKGGIRRDKADALSHEIEADDESELSAVRVAELEEVRLREEQLRQEVDRLERQLDEAGKTINFTADMLRDAIDCSLELIGADALAPEDEGRFVLPNLEARRGSDPRWTTTLDALRAPPEQGKRDFRWRKDSPIRPVTFKPPDTVDDSVVQLHLSHRLVQRLLGRFTSQGFVYDDLSRACLATSDDTVARVVLLGRLGIYGPRAARLHEEIITVTARWSPPSKRTQPLEPFGRAGEARTMEVLRESLAPGRQRELSASMKQQLVECITRDVEELHRHLEPRGEEIKAEALAKLKARGEAEAAELTKTLEGQRERVLKALNKNTNWQQLQLGFNDDEAKQLENDIRYWQDWLENVDGDLEREPARIRDFYTVQSYRIEPVGVVYLMPEKS